MARQLRHAHSNTDVLANDHIEKKNRIPSGTRMFELTFDITANP